MDNQKLINKIDELLEVLRTEQQEAKGTGLALDWLKLTGELEEYKDELESLSYRREIIILCEYEFASNYKNSIVGFSDKDCQSIIEIIINYANSKKLDGIKLKNSAILAMFNFGLRLYLHGYTINDIDFLMGEMLEALLHVTL